MTQQKLSSYEVPSDSSSLTNIDGNRFTITGVEDWQYNDHGNMIPGVKILTKEAFDIGGEKFSKFHTTRTIIVDVLSNEKLRSDLASGDEIGPVICKKVPGKNYYIMEDVQQQ